MRTITDHKLNGLNDALEITVLDEPGQGGANHVYQIEFGNNDGADATGHSQRKSIISFQNGPIQEFGVNGISNEALLAIVIDRLRGFQSGPFGTEENSMALGDAVCCLEWLQKRTRDRLARGVEGTNAK